MMDYPLGIGPILRRAEQLAANRKVVSRLPDGSLYRSTWAEVGQRARRIGSAFEAMDLPAGARVATLCVSHHQHLEMYFGVPMAGFALHPLNPRLHPDDLAYIIGHADDHALVIDEAFLHLLEQIRDRVDLDHVIVIGQSPDGTDAYEDVIATGDPNWHPPDPDEHTTALLGFTSGTTGRPKGVEVSHRAVALHTLSSSLGGWMAIDNHDVLLPVVPMFHALAWGWPYTSALLSSGLVLPGAQLDPHSLLELLTDEQVTVTGGVPTIWMALLQVLDAEPDRYDVSALRAILSGGSTAPPSMLRGYAERHGLELVHTWGMTELVMGAVALPTWDLVDAPPEDQFAHRRKQGRPMPFLEIRGRSDDGLIPWDGQTMGELEVRGAWVAGEYIGDPEASAQRWTDDGWFRTGDVVTIDARGAIEILDRSKDLVKSGGEWISTPMLEGALMSHRAVAEAAVIPIPDTKWGERPLAVVVLEQDHDVTPQQLRDHIADQVASWWLPERIEIVDAIPRTAVGKFDKRTLRQDYGGVFAEEGQ